MKLGVFRRLVDAATEEAKRQTLNAEEVAVVVEVETSGYRGTFIGDHDVE